MKSKLTPMVHWAGACWLLALLFVCLGGATAFAQSGSTNTLTSATASDLQNALDGGGTVILGFNGTITADNQFYISTDVVLDATTNNITISGGNSTPIFEVAPGVTFEIRNITISGGRYAGANGVNGTAGSNGGTRGGGGNSGSSGGSVQGGAIYNLGTNRVINCLFLTNTVVGGAGGNGGGGGGGTLYSGSGGGGGNGGSAVGGAIYNLNTLLLSNCTFIGNSALGGNGGTGGTNGSAPYGGGYTGSGGVGGGAAGAALYNAANAKVTILACTFADNYSVGGSSQAVSTSPDSGGNGRSGPNGAAATGGGIYNASSNVIVNCTFYGNLAIGGDGGNGGNAATGVYQGKGGNGGNAYGGSIYNDSTGFTAVTNCTFVGGQVVGGTNGLNGTGPYSNGTGSPGSGYGANIANNGGTFLLKNSILANPTNAANASGTITDQKYNLSSDSTPALSPGTNNNVNPLLGSLAQNGGPTLTISIAGNSPARDGVYDSSAPAYDQRGVYRPIGPRADIGAFEFGTPQYSISGNVGTPTGNITVLAQGTNSTHSVLTDSAGNFNFANLSAGTYTIIPQATNGNGFNFSPYSQSITVPPNVTNVKFSATAAYNVGGVISNAATSITVDVYTTVNGNNTFLAQTTTLTNGVYLFTNLAAGNYTIVPQNTAVYAFVPVSLPVTVPPANTNENFTAVPPTYTVSGQVTGVSTPVTLVATIGSSSTVFSSRSSDSSGNYSFNSLPAGTYTITPQPTNGYTYSPANLAVTVPPNTNSQNFTATQTYSVSGQIVNLRQATVSAVSSASTNLVFTDANGNYSISGLTAGSYTVTPKAVSGVNFNPSSIHITLPSSQAGQNFSAITTSHSAITSAHASGGKLSFTLSGTPNVVYRIQAATNLAGPWTDISTNTAAADGTLSLTNSTTNYPELYYRAVTP